MTPASYTEDTLVQQTTADYLEQPLGWESIYAHNAEDFGPNSLLGRASDREAVLTHYLSAALRSLNPGLSDAAYDDAVQQITAPAASQTLVAANREQYDLMRDGVLATFHNDKGERVRQRMKVFDFEKPENNHFLCVRELWVRGDLYRRRADLAEAIALVRDFLAKGGAPLEDVIGQTGFARNAAIVSCKEVANENDETRQRFEVMCREVFRKFKACINAPDVNNHRTDRDAIAIIYKSLQRDREQADISDILRTLSEVVSEVVEVQPDTTVAQSLYDISRIDFERLKQEFKRSDRQRTDVQRLKGTVEEKLRRMMERNPLRTDFQRRYEDIVAAYNREKDRPTIEQTFEELLDLVQGLDQEESRAAREGLDEESLAIFDLLRKPNLRASERERIKQVAVELLKTLKAGKLRVNQWCDKEATRDAVRVAIHNFLWSDETGLPSDDYSDAEVGTKTDDVFRHVFRVYPTVPSPYYESAA